MARPSTSARLPRAAALAGVAGAAAVGIGAVLRWRLWSHGVPDTPTPAVSGYFDPAELVRNRSYRRGVWLMGGAGFVLGPAVAVALACTWRRWSVPVVRAAAGRPWRAGLLFGAGLSVVSLVAGMPLRTARYAWGRHYGIITQHVGPWLGDVAKGLGVSLVLTGLAGAGAAVALSRAPRRWWMWLAGAAAALVFLGSFLAPVVIEPLFQKTRPLDDPGLERQVLDIARREGVRADRVLVNDASTRTTAANAYVSGLGASRRVVLYDTLLRDFPRDQVLMVVAHELAHVEHRHVLKGSLWGALMAVPAGLLAFAVAGGLTGFRAAPRTPAGTVVVVRRLAAVAACVSVVGTATAPLSNRISRAYEREADWTALRTTRDPDAAVGLFQGFVSRSLGVPDPPAWYQFLFGTHPTTMQRIGMAEAYRAESR